MMTKTTGGRANATMTGLAALAFELAIITASGAATSSLPESDKPILLQVDMSDTAHRIYRITETLSVGAGPTVLLYPLWIPGHHAPRARLGAVADIHVTSDAGELPWRRNSARAEALVVDTPPGVHALRISFVLTSAFSRGDGYVFSSPAMERLQWSAALFYPSGPAQDDIRVSPSVVLPSQWDYATSLQSTGVEGRVQRFHTIDLETLIDSPLYAGPVIKHVDLTPPGSKQVDLVLFPSDGNAPQVDTTFEAQHRAAIAQTVKVFGRPPFDTYTFLAPVGGELSSEGLEHARSSEDSLPGSYFSNQSATLLAHDRLQHEFIHAWNGKFRRPVGLVRHDLSAPLDDDLLWVYEGLTKYYDKVIAARSGLWSKAMAEGDFAEIAFEVRSEAGARWRTLQDTTLDPVITGGVWDSLGRGYAYYDEAALVWLEADCLIRQRSQGRRSLDDFARLFFGAAAGRTRSSYTLADVVRALNAVEPYDWSDFFEHRIKRVNQWDVAKAFERTGYRLQATDEPDAWMHELEQERDETDLSLSLGLTVDAKGQVRAVSWGSPAFQADVSVKDQIVSIAGRPFSPDALRDASNLAARVGGGVQLELRAGSASHRVTLLAPKGLAYPGLESIAGAPPLLNAILSPR